METIVILKRDLKYYFFVNYVIKNSSYKSINIILNDIVSDDIGDIIEHNAKELKWIPIHIKHVNYVNLIMVKEQLYISKGLDIFIKYFNNNDLLLNFNKLLCVEDYKKISDRISYT